MFPGHVTLTTLRTLNTSKIESARKAAQVGKERCGYSALSTVIQDRERLFSDAELKNSLLGKNNSREIGQCHCVNSGGESRCQHRMVLGEKTQAVE